MSDTAVETPVNAEAEAVEEKPKREKKAPVEPTPCACRFYSGQDAKGTTLSTGCTEVTPRTFRPGHDAKLKSLLIQVGAAGNQVTKSNANDPSTEEIDPLYAAEEFGFRNLVEKSINSAKAKAEERDAKAQERQAKKDAAAKAKEEAKAKREKAAEAKKAHAKAVEQAAEDAKGKPGPAKAKVGRTTVDGEILADGTFKYKKGDEEVETSNYTVVIDPATVPVPDVEA
jgi:hypothetical protein